MLALGDLQMKFLHALAAIFLLASCGGEPSSTDRPPIDLAAMQAAAIGPPYDYPDKNKERVGYVQLHSSSGAWDDARLGPRTLLKQVDGSPVGQWSGDPQEQAKIDAALEVAPGKAKLPTEFLPVREGRHRFFLLYSGGLTLSGMFSLGETDDKTLELVGTVSAGRYYHFVASKPGPSGAITFWMEDIASGTIVAKGVAR